jgi:Holliday junction resolvasome RuvABC endonuclease subunit
MTILAIDPSSKNLGWAILDETAVIDAGLIRSEQDDKGFRFLDMMESFLPAFEKAIENDVRLVIIEEYVTKSRFGTDAVKGIIGVIQYIIAQKGFRATFIHPATVKKSVTGNGRAEKEEVATEVYKIYPFSSRIYTDNNITDAIAIGIAGFKKIVQEQKIVDKVMELAEDNDGKLSNTVVYRSKIVKSMKEAGYILAILKSKYKTEKIKNRTTFQLPWQEIE